MLFVLRCKSKYLNKKMQYFHFLNYFLKAKNSTSKIVTNSTFYLHISRILIFMILYFRLLKESFAFALNALRNNKLRTLLSLLGVTVGIFSIIAVLAAVDSMDKKIKEDLSDMDMNTVYLMKFSFGPSSNIIL